jgi:hypothetical protein
LYRLLRPEFVRSYREALCNDSFSRFLSVDSNYRQYHRTIGEATQFLRSELIEKSAQIYDGFNSESLETMPLKIFIHRSGINMRHLGVFYNYLHKSKQRRIVIVEMVTRVVKEELRLKMRSKSQQFGLPKETDLHDIVLELFNGLFTERAMLNPETWLYYQEKVAKRFNVKIGNTSFLDQLKLVQQAEKPLCLLFKRITQVMGLMWRMHTYDYFTQNWESYKSRRAIDYDDLMSIGHVVKHLSMMSFSIGYRKKQKARQADESERKFWCMQAIDAFNEALQTSVSSEKQILLQRAHSLHMLGYNDAAHVEFTQLCNRADRRDASIFLRFAQFLEDCGQYDAAEELYVRAATVHPGDYEVLKLYADFLSARGIDAELASLLRTRASNIANGDFGPVSAKAPVMSVVKKVNQSAVFSVERRVAAKVTSAKDAVLASVERKVNRKSEPAVFPKNHDFKEYLFKSPPFCDHCRAFIWPIGPAYRCTVCHGNSHKSCLPEFEKIVCHMRERQDVENAAIILPPSTPSVRKIRLNILATPGTGVRSMFSALAQSAAADILSLNFSIKGNCVGVDIINTDRVQRNTTMTAAPWRGCNGIVIAFDLSSERAFSEISTLLNVAIHEATKAPVLLVGCKADSNWLVSEDTITKFCKETDLDFVATSAQRRERVLEAFHYAATIAVEADEKLQEEKAGRNPGVAPVVTKKKLTLRQRLSKAAKN